jgi:hypothetical protein
MLDYDSMLRMVGAAEESGEGVRVRGREEDGGRFEGRLVQKSAEQPGLLKLRARGNDAVWKHASCDSARKQRAKEVDGKPKQKATDYVVQTARLFQAQDEGQLHSVRTVVLVGACGLKLGGGVAPAGGGVAPAGCSQSTAPLRSRKRRQLAGETAASLRRFAHLNARPLLCLLPITTRVKLL